MKRNLDMMDILQRRFDLEEEYLRKLPRCDCCGEPIQTDYTYVINDELWCGDCIEGARTLTDNYV